MKKSLLLTALLCSLLSSAQPDIRALYNEALAAHKAQDFVTFLQRFQQLDSLNPEHPTITYNLAAAYGRNNQPELALKYARKALQMNATFEPEKDEDLASLNETQRNQLIQFKQELVKEVQAGQTFFTNSEKDLHPESVAFDPSSGDYFLNSVRKGKIIRYATKSGTFTDFATDRWAVMGMHQGSLWACEVATSEHVNFQTENEGKSALLRFDLKTGQLLNRYEISGGHWFGEVLISKSGQVYVSDSRQPIIYRLQDGQLVIFQDFTGRLYNLQGLAFSSDESLLYIADYKVGVHAIEMSDKTLTKLTHNEDVMTKGTDGLYFYKNNLIGIQNGVKPFRVTRWSLDKAGISILQQTYLDKARPELNEPTLGVIVGNSLVYIANSPWGAYEKGVFSEDGLSDNLVLKLPLK